MHSVKAAIMAKVLSLVVRELFKKMTVEDIREIVDTLLDKAENKLHAKKDFYDDSVQKIIDTARELLNIKDEDYGIDKEKSSKGIDKS